MLQLLWLHSPVADINSIYFKQTLAVSQMSPLSHLLVELYFKGAERFTVNV